MTEVVKKKRGPGRPRKNETRVQEVDRPRRVPVNENRNILTVRGKDPEYRYRWILDKHEQGHNVLRYLQAGYEFASPEGLEIGDPMVYRSNNVGSIVRTPAGTHSPDQYLYLVRIRKDWYEEDQAEKEKKIREKERRESRPKDPTRDEGMYGETTITHGGRK